MRIALLLFFLFIASVAKATPTWKSIRNDAYAGNIEAVEQALQKGHELSLNGEISFQAVRDLQFGLLTTHPDITDFTGDWLEAYPESPYALSVRAFQLSNAAWDMRGNKYVHETHPDALYAFNSLRSQAQALAKTAYELAPDYIPASDAVLMMELGNRSMSAKAHRDLVNDILTVTPNVGSLGRSLEIAAVQWGGGGLHTVDIYCRLFARLITNVEEYSTDVCRAEMTAWHNMLEQDVNGFAFEVLDATEHPNLFKLKVLRAFERKSDDDRQFLLEWFSDPSNLDYQLAHRFKRNFRNDEESEAIFAEMERRLQENATSALPHNPYSPSLIKVLQHDYMSLVRTQRIVIDDAYHQRNLRLTISRPFDAEVWRSAASSVRNLGEHKDLKTELILLENAIYYSGYDHHMMGNVHKRLLHAYALHQAAIDLTNSGDETFPELISVADLDDLVFCPIIRIKRIMEFICEQEGTPMNDCLHVSRKEELSDVVEIVESRDICHMERFENIDALAYQPNAINMSLIDQTMANR